MNLAILRQLARRCLTGRLLRFQPIGASAAVAVFGLTAPCGAQRTDTVFDAPDAAYTEPAAAEEQDSQGILRMISVEERTGVARQDAFVRVPVFFAAGECRNIDELAVVPADVRDAQPVTLQGDDVRRGPDGGVSRAHLWFATDLPANARRTFHLVRSKARAAAAAKPVEVEESESGLRIRTATGAVEFTATGGLRQLRADGSEWRFAGDGLSPRVRVEHAESKGAAAPSVTLDAAAAGRQVTWGTGPLFAKVRLRIEPQPGIVLEQEYRVPRHGREVTVTTAVWPGEGSGALRENRLLTGTLTDPADAQVFDVPAGVRRALRAQHAYAVTALTRGDAALLAVPIVIGGANGRWTLDAEGALTLEGQRGLKRGKEGEQRTLYAYWSEVRLVPAATAEPAALWERYLAHVQPLVAVVDEPGATVDALHAELAAVAREMKPVGWRQEAGRLLVLADEDRVNRMLDHRPVAREADEERLIASARNARAKITENGARKVREHEKGRAYGPLDPYHITYTQSAAAAVVALAEPPAAVDRVNLAMARAVRTVGGATDDAGNPYIDCFARTLNMQMGPVLFGLTAGKHAGDDALARFYRDLATAPPVLAVFGRGQRPYTGATARSPDQTDYLYQAICDFWLRTTELLGGEDLSLHPLAYGRYTDCVDVMADLYHGVAARPKEKESTAARANFYRGQAHTHRWLGWSAAPYVRLLQDPAERSGVGLTEAIHHTRAQKGRWKNWPDLTYYILADLRVREGLDRATPPQLPAAPRDVAVQRDGAAARLTWHAVPGAAEYRVFRATQPGGPWRWLHSPHREAPPAPLRGTEFVDAAAPESAFYVVLALDAEGRASRWPEHVASPR